MSRFESTIVDETGLVYGLNFTLDAAVGANSRLRTIHHEYELTRVGDVEVGPPARVTNATEPTAEQNP